MQPGTVFHARRPGEETLGLWAFSSAYGKLRRDYHTQWRQRNDFQLIIVREGHGVMQQFSGPQVVRMGDAFLIYPGERGTYRCDPEDGWHVSWVHFLGDWAGRAVSFAGFRKDRQVIRLRNPGAIEAAFDLLIEEQHNRANEHLVSVRLLGVLAEVGAQAMPQPPKSSDENVPDRFRPVIGFIHNSFGEPITVEDLARHAGYSQYHFSRSFRKLFGISPMDYVIQQRIRHAQVLLVETDLPIKEVADRCGCKPTYFARIFRERVGVAPRRFRINHRTYESKP